VGSVLPVAVVDVGKLNKIRLNEARLAAENARLLAQGRHLPSLIFFEMS
jgi:hypothetical protein